MTSDLEAEVREFVNGLIETAFEGIVANAEAMRASPADRAIGQRIRSHLIDLERLVVIRNALR